MEHTKIGCLAKYLLGYARLNADNFCSATSEDCGRVAAKSKSFFKKSLRRRNRRYQKSLTEK